MKTLSSKWESLPRRGRYAFLSLESATKALRDRSIDVLVTAPINKDTIQSEDFNYSGHTEYLESKLEGNSLMILMTNELRIGLVTGHIPLAKVSETITPELIEEKVNIMHHSLVKDFHINVPKIAILGLNLTLEIMELLEKKKRKLSSPPLSVLKQLENWFLGLMLLMASLALKHISSLTVF